MYVKAFSASSASEQKIKYLKFGSFYS